MGKVEAWQALSDDKKKWGLSVASAMKKTLRTDMAACGSVITCVCSHCYNPSGPPLIIYQHKNIKSYH